jgi:hypothetical protein
MMFSKWILPFSILILLISDVRAQLPERYTRYSDAVDILVGLEGLYPGVCDLDTVGYSTRDSVPMLRFKISDNVGLAEDEPAVFYCGGVHADEVLGVEVVMNFVVDIMERYGRGDLEVVDYVNSLEIYCVPFINPEGHIVVEEGDTDWRKNKCDNDDNGIFDFHDGVDNNRNYDFGWYIDDGPEAVTPESLMYKGEAPFTQTENIALAEFGWLYRPLIALDYHSPDYGRPNVAYYPWYWYPSDGGHGFGPDEDLMHSICQSFTSLIEAIPDDSGTGTYTARRALVNKGDYKTYFYGNFGSAAFSVEVSDTTIQDPALVDSIVAAHLPGQYYLLGRALGPGISGVIRDSVTLEPLEAEVQVLQHINADINPRLSRPDYGRYRRLLAPGTYTLRYIKEDYVTKTIYNVVVGSNGPTELDVLLRPLNPRPPAPVLGFPPSDTTLTADTVIFEWNPSGLAEFYLLEIYYDQELSDPVLIDSTLADTSMALAIPEADTAYYWRVKGGNANGWGPYSETWNFWSESVVGTGESALLPDDFALYQNYPNPFNMETVIPLTIPPGETAQLEIFDITGRLLRRYNLEASSENPVNRIIWNGTDYGGNEVKSGVYFYVLQGSSRSAAKKMILIK